MTVEISARNLETRADCLLNHSIGGIVTEYVVMIKGERIAWQPASAPQGRIYAAGAVATVLCHPDIQKRSAQHVDIVTDFHGTGSGRAFFQDQTKLEVRNGVWVAPDATDKGHGKIRCPVRRLSIRKGKLISVAKLHESPLRLGPGGAEESSRGREPPDRASRYAEPRQGRKIFAGRVLSVAPSGLWPFWAIPTPGCASLARELACAPPGRFPRGNGISRQKQVRGGHVADSPGMTLHRLEIVLQARSQEAVT